MTTLVYITSNLVHVIKDRQATASFEATQTLSSEDLHYLMTNDFTKSANPDDPNVDPLVLKRVRYEGLLESHDWFYEFSDDFSVYLRGRSEYQELMQLADEVDPKHEQYLKAFRQVHKV